MLGHGAGIGYTGPGHRMGPMDNFSLVMRPFSVHGPNVEQSSSRPAVCRHITGHFQEQTKILSVQWTLNT